MRNIHAADKLKMPHMWYTAEATGMDLTFNVAVHKLEIKMCHTFTAPEIKSAITIQI
jgi:hypothetical protein